MLYMDVVRLHRVWTNMHFKCITPRSHDWDKYGGRGIAVDAEWLDFEVFCQWALDNGYREGLQLDRRDNDGPYSSGNCRWVTCQVNQRNKRSNRILIAFGETKCLAEWAEDSRCVVSYAALQARVGKLGWDVERALTIPGKLGDNQFVRH
jgi:hypothetical protein